MNTKLKLFVLNCVFFHCFSAGAEIVDGLVAAVYDQAILESDLKKFEKTFSLRKELDPILSLMKDFNPKQREDQIDFLIDETLILQSFKIAPAEVEQEISNIIRNNNLSHEQLESFLSTKGFRLEDYQEMMKIGLAKRRLLDQEIRSRVNITDQDVKNYYFNTETARSKTSAEYELEIIALEYKNSAEKKEKQTLAYEIQNQLSHKEKDFVDIQGYQSNQGFYKLNELNPDLQEATKQLKVGDISQVIAGNNRFIILKIKNIHLSESDEYLQQKEVIRELLAKNEYRKQLELWTLRNRADAYVFKKTDNKKL